MKPRTDLAFSSRLSLRTNDITVVDDDSFREKSGQPLFVPVPLADGPVAAELLDPVRSFFRHPDEAGFWDRITADWCDATARLVYADWLDEHGHPHAGLFREPTPFADAYLRFDWVGVARQVGYQLIGHRRTLWEFAGQIRPNADTPRGSLFLNRPHRYTRCWSA